MGENDLTTIVPGHFFIRVRVGNAEIEVAAPEKDFVQEESGRLIEHFKLASAVSNTASSEEGLNGATPDTAIPEPKNIPESRNAKPETLPEFLKRFANFPTNLDRMLVIGYWCEIKQGQQNFTAEDIKERYKEIRENPPAYIKRDLDSIIKKGFLMPPEKSGNGATYMLSSSGIKEVESKMSQG